MSEELVRFGCRECGQRIEAPVSYSEVWIQCPTCEEYVPCMTDWLQYFWRRLAGRFRTVWWIGFGNRSICLRVGFPCLWGNGWMRCWVVWKGVAFVGISLAVNFVPFFVSRFRSHRDWLAILVGNICLAPIAVVLLIVVGLAELIAFYWFLELVF